MAENMAYGTVKAEVGPAAVALGWIGLALLAIPALVLFVLIKNITLLDRLIE